ncbi:putative membrane protein [Gammaproteobacteria bacterium]
MQWFFFCVVMFSHYCKKSAMSLPFLRFRWLLALILATTVAVAALPPVVRAVVFISPQCALCQDLYAYLLPSLTERYGDRLELTQVDVTQPNGAAIYQAAVASYGLGVWSGVPIVLVGKQALTGLDAIAVTLGDDFESLATGVPSATHWPDLPGLATLLPEGMRALKAQMAAIAPLPQSNPSSDWRSRFLQDPIGNSLALFVLFIMLVALTHTLIRLRHGASNPQFASALLPLVFVIGIGISAYTAYAALVGVAPICGPVGDCAAVQSSVYSRLFGIPLGIFGIMNYTGLLVSRELARRLSPNGGGWHWLPWAMALGGFSFSLRLTTLEPFVIGATCLWCLSSALAMTAALWLLAGELHEAKDRPTPVSMARK